MSSIDDIGFQRIKKIICLDEISIHTCMKHNYSRCYIGQRCVKKSTDNRIFTLIVAISYKGVIAHKLFEKGGVNANRLISFCSIFLPKLKNNLIIMDNAPSHKSKIINEFISKTENKLHYSVPYKPSTNTIESWFSKFKHKMISWNGLTFIELKEGVKKTIKAIPKIHYINYLKYTYKTNKKIGVLKKESTKKRQPKNYK